MDIAALSVVLSNSRVRADASLAVMANIKDLLNQQSNQLTEMLNQSVPQVSHPILGNSVDIKL